MTARVLTLLTDFGLDDYYVAAVKGVILSRAPTATLVDISHTVPPGDVAAGAFLLGAAVPWFPPGSVHLAVVDPGVGSHRRLLVADSPHGWLVGPDNGLFTPLLSGARAWSVTRGSLFLEAPGQTFHGRDRFAPIAAYLLNGGDGEELGPEIDDPVLLPQTPPVLERDSLSGSVIHVDRFGNLITNLPEVWVPKDRLIEAEVAGYATTHYATHYADMPEGEPAIVPGSLGTLELSLKNGDLARFWGRGRGARVRVRWKE